MPAFEYVALDSQGKQKKGVEEADSQRQVRQTLRERGWIPLNVETASERRPGSGGGSSISTSRRTIGGRNLALVTRQMATLVQAGLPLEEVLRTIANQSEKGRIKSIMMAVRARVLEGHTLAVAMSEFPGTFSELYRSTVSAGEHSGHLGLVLANLADYTERRHQSAQKVQMALLYPCILTVVAVGIAGGLMAFVLPSIVDVFDSTGEELPLLTRVLINIGNFLRDYGILVIIVLVGLGFLLRYLSRRPGVQEKVHRLFLRLPLIRRFSRESNSARFASTLAILTGSGVPLVEGLSISGQVISNVYLRKQVDQVTQLVKEGTSLHRALIASGAFPPIMVYMIASGEASGELESMLARTAENQERELDQFSQSLVGLFEPAMTLAIAGLVLIIILAILGPILSLNQIAL